MADNSCGALSVRNDGAQICANGFITNTACNPAMTKPEPLDGIRLPYTPVPYCCREEWCGRFYEKNGGKPIISTPGETP